jgi:leucyl-tRNA synthetase
MIYGGDGEKMSKSKGNVVEPIETIENYGVDTLRFFLVSVSSPEKDFPWSEQGIIGAQRFLVKLKSFFEKKKFSEDSDEVLAKLNGVIKNVEAYYDNFNYRKATIELRELFELIVKKGASKQTLEKYLQILSPICPHISEELWERLGNKKMISVSSWPKVKEIQLKKKQETFDLNEKVGDYVSHILKRLESRGEKIEKVYLYAVPFEKEKIDKEKISQLLSKPVEVFSTSDKDKYDPEGKSKKARPGMPGIYLK